MGHIFWFIIITSPHPFTYFTGIGGKTDCYHRMVLDSHLFIGEIVEPGYVYLAFHLMMSTAALCWIETYYGRTDFCFASGERPPQRFIVWTVTFPIFRGVCPKWIKRNIAADATTRQTNRRRPLESIPHAVEPHGTYTLQILCQSVPGLIIVHGYLIQ